MVLVSLIELFLVVWAVRVITSSLAFRKSGVDVMDIKNKSEMNVEDNHQRSDDEEGLKDTAWKNWTLVKVCFAVSLIFSISLVAFFLSLILFFRTTKSSNPFLREPAHFTSKGNVVSKDILVHEEICDENSRHPKAEKIKHPSSILGRIFNPSRNERNQNC